MGILSNAISGLQASQVALRTTGHNISNANTEGYSRQKVEFGTRPPQATGVGFIGSGVITESIQRVFNEFVTRQLRSDTTTHNEMDKFDQLIGNIDSLLAESGTGLSTALQSFFAAVQTGADDPSSVPARQLIIAESDSLTSRFNLLYGRLESISSAIRNETSVIVSEINSLAKSIGTLNLTIQQQLALSQGDKPNDLLDQRDEQLRKLSGLVAIQVIEQDKGDVNVMIGSGQPLVVGQAVSQFSLVEGDRILLNNKVNSIDVTDALNGGQLGGLLRFRGEVLDSAFNELGRVAIVMADEFNRIQEQGLDLDGDFGTRFFTEINDPILMSARAIGARDNAPPNNRNVAVEIVDTSALTIEDYTLRLLPGTQNYIVTRNSDDVEITQGILPGAFPATIRFDGLAVHLNSGSFQGGDEFLIQPTRRGSVDIQSALDRPEDIAFATPIRTRTNSGNIGTGIISEGEMLSRFAPDGSVLPAFSVPGQLTPPILIHFTSPTTYDVLDNSNSANPQHLVPPLRNQSFIPGVNNLVFNEDPGATLITGNGGTMGLPPGSIPTVQAVGGAAQNNGYPVELLTFTTTNPATGATSSQTLTTNFNSSISTTATLLSNIEGVTANPFTEAVITDLNIANFNNPLQIRLNGQSLIEYSGGAIVPGVPDPNVNEGAFNDYLADRINNNPALAAYGIHATSTSDPITGNPKLRIVASTGVNLDVRLEGVAGDTIDVNDGINPNVRLTAAGAGTESLITVGGRIDLTLASNVRLTTVPSTSQFFGNSTAPNFAQSIYKGYQVVVKGQPQADDRFTIEYNNNATIDNRNALRFVDTENRGVIANNSLSLSASYNHLVERIGTVSNLSQINSEASKALLLETQTRRDSMSGVNLDEEAASLIQYEQVYNANARVISVARDLFDTLLNSI